MKRLAAKGRSIEFTSAYSYPRRTQYFKNAKFNLKCRLFITDLPSGIFCKQCDRKAMEFSFLMNKTFTYMQRARHAALPIGGTMGD